MWEVINTPTTLKSMAVYTRLRDLLVSDFGMLRLISGIMSLILGAAFICSQQRFMDHNYTAIGWVAPFIVWGIAFCVHGFFQTLNAVHFVNRWVMVAISVLGIQMWSYLLFSFVIFDDHHSNPTEWLFIIPIMIELLILAEHPSASAKRKVKYSNNSNSEITLSRL